MIEYTLPGMTEHADLLSLFIGLKESQPGMFFEDVAIQSVYGGFAGCALCGGRNNLGKQPSLEGAAALIGRYNERGVACNATFTNQFVEEGALAADDCANGLLRALAQGCGNGVIVRSDVLAAYVRREFPQLKLILSTTASLGTPAAHNRACKDFDRVVLDYNLTHDDAALAQLEHPEAIELMVNEYCTLGCPWREEHYRAVSAAQLEGRACDFACRHSPAPQAHGFMQGLIDGDVFLHNADVRRVQREHGIGCFKIVGRGLDRYDVIDALLYYLVQPDCWYEIRDFLVHHDYL